VTGNNASPEIRALCDDRCRGVAAVPAAAAATAVWAENRQIPVVAAGAAAIESIVNNSGYLHRLFYSRTKSESLNSHKYVSGWLLCCH